MSSPWDDKLPVGLRFMVTKTTKGRIGLIIGQHKFRKAGTQKDGTLIFRCSLKDCPARVNLDAAMRRVLKIRMNHTHPGRDLSDIINVRLPSEFTSPDGLAVEEANAGGITGGSKSFESSRMDD
ncbi:Elongation factor G [Frankliniella fusca]|uniref:Elongation factor G n=1 Tax=Frankliniella fusca TaxID=407009 RepID=A0AAE1HC81_9NEOP|nr:Elongation factor G [Frankliniella fusca]